VGVGPPGTITPFNPYHLQVDATSHGPDPWAERQELLSVHPDARSALDSHSLSSPRTPALMPPPSQPVAPVPTGLSSKELARLRTEALSSQKYRDSFSSVIEYASVLVPSRLLSPSRAVRSGYRRLRDYTRKLKSLRREMQQLRTERFEAPPGYTSGLGDA